MIHLVKVLTVITVVVAVGLCQTTLYLPKLHLISCLIFRSNQTIFDAMTVSLAVNDLIPNCGRVRGSD